MPCADEPDERLGDGDGLLIQNSSIQRPLAYCQPASASTATATLATSTVTCSRRRARMLGSTRNTSSVPSAVTTPAGFVAIPVIAQTSCPWWMSSRSADHNRSK